MRSIVLLAAVTLVRIAHANQDTENEWSGASPAPATPPALLQPTRFIKVFAGEAAGDQFGWMARSAGDVDGDGRADVLISAPFKTLEGPNAGRIYVYSSWTAKVLFHKDGGPQEFLGIGIEGAGDVNADGTPDVIVGAMGVGGTGAAYVYSGKDGEVLHTFLGEGQGDRFGRKVAGTGDLDGDGHADLIVGAPLNDGAGQDAGRVYVYSGKDGSELDRLDGEPGAQFGGCVDGYVGGDQKILIIGAQDAGEGQAGAAYVFDYDPEGCRLAFTIEASEGDKNLGRMFLSAVGDVNADGLVDVYVSDWESSASGKPGSGRVYVHSGKDGSRLHTFDGEAAGDGFGIGTAEAGDIDQDGHDDLIIGAWQSKEGAPSGGKCYLYSGKSGALLRAYTCAATGETFGFDATGMGDLDGDGSNDFLITGAYSPYIGPQSGRVYLIAGPHKSVGAGK